MEIVTNSPGSQKRIPLSIIQLTHQHAQSSGFRVQGSAQVRAATAQVQRRKWTLERSSFGADYIGYSGELTEPRVSRGRLAPEQERQAD